MVYKGPFPSSYCMEHLVCGCSHLAISESRPPRSLKPKLLLTPPQLSLCRINYSRSSRASRVLLPQNQNQTFFSTFFSSCLLKKLILTELPLASFQRREVLLKVIGKKGTNGCSKGLKCRVKMRPWVELWEAVGAGRRQSIGSCWGEHCGAAAGGESHWGFSIEEWPFLLIFPKLRSWGSHCFCTVHFFFSS